MKMNTATVADVEKALADLKVEIEADPTVEGLFAKKLAVAVEALTPKSAVTGVFKRLQRNALRDFAANKEQKISGYTDDPQSAKLVV